MLDPPEPAQGEMLIRRRILPETLKTPVSECAKKKRRATLWKFQRAASVHVNAVASLALLRLICRTSP